MGTITESFGNLSDYLLAMHKKSKGRASDVELITSRVLKSFLPSGIRSGSATVTDIKDRQVGPFDVVAGIDAYPPFSEGTATTFLADGIVFVLQIRNWAESDLTQFGDLARQLKKLERRKKDPIPCLAVSFEKLAIPEVSQFLNSKAGQSVDGILSVGQSVILRNSSGLYGDPTRVPFVTEQQGPEALKAFTFYLLQLAHSSLEQPFGLADYQHL
jgi:hypothetical protein